MTAVSEIIQQAIENVADRFPTCQVAEHMEGYARAVAKEALALSRPASAADASAWRKDVAAAPYGERILLKWDDCKNLQAHVELGKRTSTGWVNTYGNSFGNGDPTDWMPLPT